MFCIGVEAPQNIYLGSAPLLLYSECIERFCVTFVNGKFITTGVFHQKTLKNVDALDLSRIVLSSIFR